MAEKSEHLKDAMPTERKSTWRTAEERRMSDLTRVLEWLERRQGKKKQQKPKETTTPKTNGKEEKKEENILKQQRGKRQVVFINQPPGHSAKKGSDPATHGKLYGSVDPRGRHLSMVSSNYTKEGPRKSDLDIKDAIALESAQRPLPYRRQSILDSLLQETPVFGRRSTLLRDWVISRSTDISYERKLKSLMEKGAEPKVELAKLLKPEEVLSCRYLRLSKNNIRTLLKLCKDAGMDVDIHPHMVEGEIDAKKVFAQNPSVAL